MPKNEVVVRTPQDLEKKYNLGSIGGMKRNIELTAQGIQELNNELYKILTTLVINLKDVLDNQSEISLWFYSGIPTTKKQPYKSWTKPSDHIGDIYYDQDTGYVYQYKEVDGAGVWESNVSPDLVEAMAITNSELDTATDHERKVFFDTPVIPYSNGDWWVKEDGSLFICQLSKTSGTLEENDFISSNNYTESIAEKIGDEIKVLKGTITQISDNFAKFTDLATGKSTTISGDNITSGSLQSNNYIDNVSGTKISLDDGTINTKNFKVDENGNVICNDATIKGTAILNGDKFKVEKDGTLTCSNANVSGKITGSTIEGGTISGTTINTDKNLIVGNNAYIGQNQSPSGADVKKIIFSDKTYIQRVRVSGIERLTTEGELISTFASEWGVTVSDENNASGIDIFPDTIQLSRTPSIASDQRLKQEIKNINVDWIDSLKVKEYEYINTPDKKQIGLIAQDYIEEDYSKYFLNENEDGYYSITYGNITNALIQYCQELKQEVKQLHQEIAELKKEGINDKNR